MPAKSVLRFDCDRCTRTWYVDAEKAAATPKEVLNLSMELEPGSVVKLSYECLCEGCKKTVKSLVSAIGKDFKKAAPVRGAKKKVSGGEAAAESAGKGEVPPPTDPAASPITLPDVIQTPSRPSSSPPASGSAATSVAAGKVASSSVLRPTPR